MKRECIRKLDSTLQNLRAKISKLKKDTYVPAFPGTQRKGHPGARMIGRALCWSAEKHFGENSPRHAMNDLLVAMRWGAISTQGDSADAMLGLSIVLDAVRVIESHFQQLQANDLSALAAELERVQSQLSPLEFIVESDRRAAFYAVQYIQDCFKTSRFRALSDLMGPDGKPAVEYLQEMQRQSQAERVRYFRQFAAEISARSQHDRLAVSKLAVGSPEPYKTTSSFRPWKRFVKHFAPGIGPVLALSNQTKAKLRMLQIFCKVKLEIIVTKKAPRTLASLPGKMCEDPYSGMPFVYRADGQEFKLYSIGPNRQDDGGDTDATGTEPDLLLNIQ